MIRASNVTAGFGDEVVLSDVSLEVRAGQVVVLPGPNGPGKTTLLRALAGEITLVGGKAELAGDDVSDRPPFERVRRGLCHIPEGRAIFPNLTVRDNLVMHSRKGKENESIACAVDAFPWMKERLKQVLAMSRAYLASPELVLVDEASMGLAPVIVHRLFDFPRKIVAEGVSLLLVEQYVTPALDMATTAISCHTAQSPTRATPSLSGGGSVQ